MEFIIAGIVVGMIIGVFVYLAKKDNERLSDYVEKLSDQQKVKLEDVNIEFSKDTKNAWTQNAYICDVNEKNEKVSIVYLWHNKVINNNTYNQIQHGDLKMKKAEFDKLGIKEGDFVRIYIDVENVKSQIIAKV